MTLAALLIDDTDVTIRVTLDLDDVPFDPESMAHQTAAQLLKHMDTIAQRVPQEQPKAAPPLLLGPNGMPMLAEGES